MRGQRRGIPRVIQPGSGCVGGVAFGEGPPGPTGPAGAAGADGADGAPGEQGPPGADGMAGLANLALENCLFVAKNGNDATALTERLDKPFLTLTAAKAAAVSGDTIFVYPGTYAESNLLKNGVNWHFYDGAIVQITAAPSATASIFNDNGSAVTSSISGRGAFIILSTSIVAGSTGGCFRLSHSGSVLRAQGKLAEFGGDNSTSGALTIVNCSSAHFEFDEILAGEISSAPRRVGSANAVYWEQGEVFIRANLIRSGSAYALWGVNDSVISGSLWCYANEIITDNYQSVVIEGIANSPKHKMWVYANYIEGYTDQQTARGVVRAKNSKLYVTAQKIFARSDPDNSLAADVRYCAQVETGGQFWLNCQKLTANGGWIYVSGGTLYADVLHFEDELSAVGDNWESGISVTEGIVVSSGTLHLQGLVASTLNGSIVKHSGGLCHIANLKLDTSATNVVGNQPALVSASGLSLHNCVLVAPALADSIYAGSAQTVGILGNVMANKDVNANITISPLGSFTVDTAVV